MFDLINLPEEQQFIKSAIAGNVVNLSLDGQGTHVVQKLITSYDEQERNFIFQEVYDNFMEIATNTNGLCVIKKLVT
eukprot:CAMPEP_0170541078 /NCGR_PEP_ID=MMETSP0211-20121228/916_1 /TAXON_ID=311385 /ORGANISM="Pseudokeronopsis sp., Strain OXSARD2" /LENGTH=76 /DNA_ID=CAMNT_0010843685 /DNA_START=2125 /DNA_END=2355 /DNA_ORIENTATION=-